MSKEIESGISSTTAEIYNTIRLAGRINRMSIMRKIELSKSTVSIQVAKMLRMGIIKEVDNGSNLRKLDLQIVDSFGYVAGIFLGIHKLSIVIFNLSMQPQKEHTIYLENIIDPKECNKHIIQNLHDVYKEFTHIPLLGIGIGFPFPVNFKEGKPDSPPNVPAWHNYPLKKLYEDEFKCPVLIDNDVNVMALGEKSRGAAQNESDFLFIKLGTGIGSGLMVHGEIYRGAQGCAGDIGHIAVADATEPCVCGLEGCLEAVIGGKALSLKAHTMGNSGESLYLQNLLSIKKNLTPKDIQEGSLAGDIGCIHLIQHAGKALGSVCAKLVNFFNPESIIIGGGLSGFGHMFIGPLREVIITRSPHLATFDLRVTLSDLGDKAGPIGAGAMIIDHIFSPQEFQNTLRQ